MSRSADTIRDILSGKRRGFRARLVRLLLFPMSHIWRSAVAMRNRLYDWKLRRVHQVDCRVISVGNLTTGGTGKTPLVETLARMLHADGVNVVVVSRGYGRKRGRKSDEQLLLGENLAEIPHVTDPDRVAAAREAIRKHNAEVVIMDDGFQHRRLRRDLDIVTIDATNPFGYGHILPRGLLREPPKSLRRADVAVITRSKLVPPQEPPRLEATLREIAPALLVVHAEEEVLGLRKPDGTMLPAKNVREKHVVAFCGIGNPEGFLLTLTNLGARVDAFFAFSDHHRYRKRDLDAVNAEAHIENADMILTTQKDAVKIDAGFHWQQELLVVRIGCRITRGQDVLKERIDAVVRAKETAS